MICVKLRCGVGQEGPKPAQQRTYFLRIEDRRFDEQRRGFEWNQLRIALDQAFDISLDVSLDVSRDVGLDIRLHIRFDNSDCSVSFNTDVRADRAAVFERATGGTMGGTTGGTTISATISATIIRDGGRLAVRLTQPVRKQSGQPVEYRLEIRFHAAAPSSASSPTPIELPFGGCSSGTLT